MYTKQQQTRKPKSSKRRTVTRLDRKFSELIRKRDGLRCRKCGKHYPLKESGSIPQGLQCAHIKSRRYYNTRWQESNAIALCGGCHIHFTGNPFEFVKWLIDEGIHTEESLQVIEHQAQQPFSGDYMLIELYLDAELKRYRA